MDPAAARVGANVRAEMAREGVTQTALANSLGRSQSGLSKRLRGVVPFSVADLVDIAEVLGVDVATLLGESS